MYSESPDRTADELDDWLVIADGTNYLQVKTATLEWLADRGFDPADAGAIDLRLDFLAGPSGSAAMRTRVLRRALSPAT